jgi:hypothetical protein
MTIETTLESIQNLRSLIDQWGVTSETLIAAAFLAIVMFIFSFREVAGWFLREPGLTTVDGIGIGSTRATLNAAGTVTMVPDSTLGIEFSMGELGGFLTADGAAGAVESLYAGLTCFFG